MTTSKKFTALAAAGAVAALALTGCTQADTVSHNLSRDADSFKIHRDIVFHNDITGEVLAKVSGLCSLGNDDAADQRTVTCKIGEDSYVKEIFQMGDNTSVISIQTEAVKADPFAYKIVFKPTVIDFDLQVGK